MTNQEPDTELALKLLALTKREGELQRELADVQARIGGLKWRLLPPLPVVTFSSLHGMWDTAIVSMEGEKP